MESNEHNKQTIEAEDTENRLTVVRGRGVGGLGEIGEAIKQNRNRTTDNITRGKGGGET